MKLIILLITLFSIYAHADYVDGSGSGLTDAQLRSSPVIISGTVFTQGGGPASNVSVTNFPAVQVVSGPFFQVTQPVSIATMPSTPVTGTFFQATQPVSGSVSVSNFPATTSVSNFPASQTVNGSVSVSNFPASVSISSGSISVDNFPATTSVSNFPATTSVSNFPAIQTVSGSVNVGNFPATISVSGGSVSVSNFPATTSVSNFPTTISVSNQPSTISVSNFPAVQTIDTVDAFKATYSAAAGNITLAATPTDIFTITGSATKVVKVTSIHTSCTQTTGSYEDVFLIKRSTANTLGTSSTPTVIPVDSNDAAGTAVVRSYTANPTLGVSVGSLRVEKIPMGTPLIQTGGGNNPPGGNVSGMKWQATAIDKAITLRGTSQVLSINLNGQTVTGASCSSWITWTEE